MKTILLLAGSENERTAYLRVIAGKRYIIEDVRDAETAADVVGERLHELSVIIADHPAGMDGIVSFIAALQKANSYMMAVPLLILTDDVCKEADEAYLDDTAVGLIVEGESEKTVLHRIEKSMDVLNSATFQEFEDMLKALPSLIYLKDNQGRYVFCSQYWHHLDHYDDPDWTIRGKTDMDIRKNQDNARLAYESDMRIVASGKGTSYVIEENEDDQREFLQLIKEPLKDEDGNVKGIIAIINNVTEQEELRRELKRKSITDELTGLYNRMYFNEYIGGLSRESFPISFVSADCDGLKEINDLYGHIFGDEYIRMAAALLKNVLPENVPIFRMGGDEFLAVLPRTGEQAAAKMLEELNHHERAFSVRQRPLSVSFGTSTMRVPTGSLERYIQISDNQMYKNKKKKKESHSVV